MEFETSLFLDGAPVHGRIITVPPTQRGRGRTLAVEGRGDFWTHL